MEACALVGVDADALGAALGAADEDEGAADEGAADAGSPGGAAWAGARRDQLLAVLYSRLFTWLVNAVNDHIKVRPLPPPALPVRTTFLHTHPRSLHDVRTKISSPTTRQSKPQGAHTHA